MPFDFSKLSGKIVEKYGTQYNFAKAMGISEHSLSNKLNNKNRSMMCSSLRLVYNLFKTFACVILKCRKTFGLHARFIYLFIYISIKRLQ